MVKTRQAVLVKPGQFEIRNTKLAPKAGQVLVEMQGCGLCTWELNHWIGRLGKCPQVLGHEAWGVVAAVGPKCDGRVKVGSRVTGLAGKSFADYYVMPEKHAMLLADDLDQQCVPGEPLYCVHNVVRAAHPEIGDSVAVVGCGPMGLWSLQALAHRALQSVIAIDIDPKKLALARKYGATHTLDARSKDLLDQVKQITCGRLVDVAVEATGAPAGMQTAIDILRGRRPRLVVCSSFKHNIEIDIIKLLGKAVEVLHAHPGICANVDDGVRRTEILINNGVFKTDRLISHRWKLADIQQAFQTLENRPKDYMKGIVTR